MTRQEQPQIIKERKKLVAKKKRHNPFQRENIWRIPSLTPSWRKPRGYSSKMRLKLGNKPVSPNIGYKNAPDVRYLHPSGYEEVYVCCAGDMEKIDAQKQAIRFSRTLGNKKKEVLLQKAAKAGIKVLNK